MNHGPSDPIAIADHVPGSRASWWAWAVGVIVVGVAAVFLVVFASRFGVDPRLSPSPLIGQTVADLELPLLDDPERTFRFADHRGEVLVVNFWASWCVPCRIEHPALVATADAYRDRGVTFVGVVYQDRPAQARAFLDELGRGESYVYATDPGSRAAIEFGVFGIPETFFVDADGVIVGKISGATNAILLAETLEKILAGERPGEQQVGEVQPAG